MAARPVSHRRKGLLKGLQLTLLTPPSAITVFYDEIEKEKVARREISK